MTSSQDQRYQERLARQRGAGTHKIANVGFSIQPLGRPPVPVAPPPPPPKAPAPKVPTPKPEAPIQESPSRRSSRSASQNSSPTVDTAASATRKDTGPSPLREGAIASPPTAFEAPIQPETDIPAIHRTSLHGFATPTIAQPSSNASSVSRIDTPTSHVLASRASTRSTTGRAPAVAAVTPVARGKRTRQPSPDRLLTPEVVGINKGVREENGNLLVGGGVVGIDDGHAIQIEGREDEVVVGEGQGEVEEMDEDEDEVVGMEVGKAIVEEEVEKGVVEEGVEGGENSGKNTAVELANVTTELVRNVGKVVEVEHAAVQVVEKEDKSRGSTIATRSPGSWNKRRKVILEESDPEKALPQEAERPTTRRDRVETANPKRKRQTVGKKPAPLRISEDEEEGAGGVSEVGEELDELYELEEEGRNEPPQSRKRPSKPPSNHQPKPKSKPRRRAQPVAGEDDDEEPVFTFPVIVHRLSKSLGFTLPPGSQRGGVNPIDVINQVSVEIIDKYFLKAKSNVERKAVENFKEELSLRFLELTDVLEHNIILMARARQAQKRKAQLVTELLAIKQKRENVAVKMDDVRKTHELATKSGEDQQNISKTFEDILGTLERGKARQPEVGETSMDGFEALIRKVSVAVTGGDGNGAGLLATVVEFNKFLERAERVLSERRRQ